MQVPSQLLEALRDVDGFNKESFQQVHYSGSQITSVRSNTSKPVRQFPNFPIPLSKIPWCEAGYYLSERPSFTFDPLFHAGCYYVQEASSMFIGYALKQTVDLSKPLKVLDLCAAPGGKSTHIQSLLSKESLLVSNEVIRSRVNILKDNMIKWGGVNVVVTNNDPEDFSGLESYFDLIVIDAPCSGSGLFRRDPEAISEWSEQNVEMCSKRQKRILTDILPALKNGGVLIYSTCSYSKEEDEDIVDWLVEDFPLAYCPLPIDPSWGIIDTGKGYRFWPDQVKGEGFFLAAFRMQGGDNDKINLRRNKVLPSVSNNEMMVLEKWVKTNGFSFIKKDETIYAWPENLTVDINYLLHELRVVYSGLRVGDWVRDKLIPDHALAMSNLVSDDITMIELDRIESIEYLQRKPLALPAAKPGWQLVSYEKKPLGWVNVLSNRVNNYYPKELRILKERETG